MAKVKQTELDGNGNVVEKAPKAAKAPKAPKEKKPKVKTVRVYTFAKEPAEGVKVAPQLALIIKHVKAAGEQGIEVPKLVAALDADDAFQTRQPVERILSYYQNTLTINGIITIEKREVEVAANENGGEAQAAA